MKFISVEEFNRVYEKLPETLKEFILSENTNASLNVIIDGYHLIEDKALIIRSLFALVILGKIDPDHLENKMVEHTGIDHRAAKELAQKIKLRMLSPVAGELNKAYGFHLAPHTETTAGTHQVDSGLHIDDSHVGVGGVKSVGRPVIPEQTNLSQTTPLSVNKPPISNPFILHEHILTEEVSSVAKDNRYEGGLVRPSFYTPPGGNISGDEAPRAHLEIGTPDIQEEPQTARIGKESARVVHYSTPEALADPFSPAQSTPQTKPAVDKKDVPPSNVVNLKDLPQ